MFNFIVGFGTHPNVGVYFDTHFMFSVDRVNDAKGKRVTDLRDLNRFGQLLCDSLNGWKATAQGHLVK